MQVGIRSKHILPRQRFMLISAIFVPCMANMLRHSWFRLNRVTNVVLPTLNYRQSLPLIFATIHRDDDRLWSHISRRTLYSDQVLGVDRFVNFREQICRRFGSQKDLFIGRLKEHIAEENNAMLSEDLKNLIFLCETSEDVELLKRAIDKFEMQNQTLRFGMFQFGPVVMRLARHLNSVEVASWIFEPKYKEFFTQISSVTIAMDILFDNGKYEDVLKLFDYVMENFNFDVKYPVDCAVLYFAACYKLNTEETFDRAFRLLRSIQMSNSQVKMRGMFFFLALAVNQNHPNIALEIINSLKLKSFNTILQSIRLIAFARIGRFFDVAEIMRFNLKKDKAMTKNKFIFLDSLNQVITLVNESKKDEFIEKIETLARNLQEANLVETNQTLDQALTATIHFVRRRERPEFNSRDEQRHVQ